MSVRTAHARSRVLWAAPSCRPIVRGRTSLQMNRLFQLASRFLSFGWFSPYESANWSPRRSRVPGAAPGDAKRDLTPGIRSELTRRSRYLQKNSGFVRELVGNMAIYSTGDGIKPQAQSPDPNWNRQAE